MGAASGTDLAGFEAQLAATKLFPTSRPMRWPSPPRPTSPTTMDQVRTFLFDKGLLGSGAASADVIGIELPDGKVLGDSGNIKLRFTDDLHEGRGRRHALSVVPIGGAAFSAPHSCPSSAEPRPCAGSTPGRAGGAQLALMLLPFVLLVARLLRGSAARLAENPSDKLLPALAALADAINRMAFQPDRAHRRVSALVRHGCASLGRLFAGLGISTRHRAGLRHGHRHAALCCVRCSRPFFAVDLDGAAAGAAAHPLHRHGPWRNLQDHADRHRRRADHDPRPGAQGAWSCRASRSSRPRRSAASSWQIALRVVLPQILPRLITCLRLQLGPAWLFLIAAEAISSDSGLGYRIFLVRRYLSMDVIFPYVVWITLLAVLTNFVLDRLAHRASSPGPSWGRRHERIVIDNVWKEYGDQIVLEKHLADDRSPAPSSRSSARPAAARRRSCACCSARNAPTSGTITARWRAAAARARPGSRRRVPALLGLSASDRARQCPARQGVRGLALHGTPVRRGPPRGDRGGAALIAEVGLAGAEDQVSRRSSRAACSSGWRWRRR